MHVQLRWPPGDAEIDFTGSKLTFYSKVKQVDFACTCSYGGLLAMQGDETRAEELFRQVVNLSRSFSLALSLSHSLPFSLYLSLACSFFNLS